MYEFQVVIIAVLFILALWTFIAVCASGRLLDVFDEMTEDEENPYYADKKK
jgi:hypothetical protein